MRESDPSGPTLTLSVTSTPFAGDTPTAPQFYEAIGRVVVLWGRFEHHFDGDLLMCSNIAFHRYGIEREMQISLRRKTKLMRELFRIVPVFQPLLPICEALADDIDDASDDRNLLLHSHGGYIRASDPPILELYNHRHRSGKLIISTARVTLAQLANLAATIDGLNTRMLALTFNLGRYQDWPGDVGGKAPPPSPLTGDPKTPAPE